MKHPIHLPGPSGLFLMLALAACNAGERNVPTLNDVNTQLAFTCAYEKDRLPVLDPEADQLYRHARWLRRNNIIQQDPMVNPVMERLYRIATAYGHDKANLDLREMIGRGTAMSADPVKETLDLTEDLIRRGIPGGYYDMGRYLEAGYGVKQDPALANRYYRKAADLGSPEAQYLIGDKFYRMTISNPLTFAIALQMLKCAGEQGHGKAAITYGVYAQGENNADAIQAFIQATKAGNELGPSYLADAFGQPYTGDQAKWEASRDLGFKPDAERMRRYTIISDTLTDYTWANPKVPELDSIVPLPPAPLPPWDGKIQWLKDFEANVPPPLPPEQRIRELAAAKALDQETGRPDPKAQAAQKAQAASLATPPPSPDELPIGTLCHSGATCPQTGHWQVRFPPDSIQGQYAELRANRVVRIFLQGNILPPHTVHYPRLLQRWRGYAQRTEAVQWQLVGYLR